MFITLKKQIKQKVTLTIIYLKLQIFVSVYIIYTHNNFFNVN